MICSLLFYLYNDLWRVSLFPRSVALLLKSLYWSILFTNFDPFSMISYSLSHVVLNVSKSISHKCLSINVSDIVRALHKDSPRNFEIASKVGENRQSFFIWEVAFIIYSQTSLIRHPDKTPLCLVRHVSRIPDPMLSYGRKFYLFLLTQILKFHHYFFSAHTYGSPLHSIKLKIFLKYFLILINLH